MKIFGAFPSSNPESPDVDSVWEDYLQFGLDGLIVETREEGDSLLIDRTQVLPSLDPRSWVERLSEQKPAGCCFLMSPYDTATAEWGKTVSHDGQWFSPRVNHNIAIIQAAVKENSCHILSVNGLGMKALDVLLEVFPGGCPILCYVSSEEDRLTEVMQLTWLKAKGYQAGLKAGSIDSLLNAAALGVEIVILPWPLLTHPMYGQSLVQRIKELGEIARGKGCRPVTASEIETLDGTEVCLVAAHHLSPGVRIQESDVMVSAHRRRGLAPYLLSDIVNRKVLYSMKPGDPLRFGLLGEKREDE